MWMKIIFVLLMLQVGGSFSAPSASIQQVLQRSKRGDDNGSAAESCCARRRKMVELGPGE